MDKSYKTFLFGSNIDINEKLANYHRFGKILNFNKYYFIIQFIFLFLVFIFFIFIYIEKINNFFISKFYLLFNDVEINNFYFLNPKWGISLKYIVIPGKYPTTSFVLYNLVLSILLIILININPIKSKINLAIRLFIFFLILPLLSSCIYFLIMNSTNIFYFPYTIKDFSLLYLSLQNGSFIFISIILSLAISFLSFSFRVIFLNVIFYIFVIFYTILFGYLRYLFFLMILNKYSYLYMASLFFSLGPFIDFIYLTFFYGLYLSFINKTFNNNKYYKFIQ